MNKQNVSYAIIDLEMCRVPKFKKAETKIKSEIIQIGVTLMDSAYNVVGEFQSYVCPDFGVIDAYIYNLTGISNTMVEKAPKLSDVLSKLAAWLPSETVMVAWSDNDEKQLRRELEAKEINGSAKILEMDWLDCQKLFADKLDAKKSYRLSEALNIADIYYDDGAHDALVDARNTAMLFRKLQTEARLQLNSCYFGGTGSFSATFSLGALVGGLAC